MFRRLLLASSLALALALPVRAEGPAPQDWPAIEQAARGQTVYWNAWAGDERINAYIAWVGEQMQARHGVTVTHVKLTDTAEAVARVLAEKTAGTTSGGAVDLIWINGENFAAMKRQGLLQPPGWAEALPNFKLTNAEANPDIRSDFTVPVEGQESPWGRAQIVFYHDTAQIAEPPRSLPALLDFARANPGRFTYPLPPDFLGSTFLKQALIGLTPPEARGPLFQPVEQADFAAMTAPLWTWMDQLHPHLHGRGESFPANGPAMRRLMADGEVWIAFAFDPAEPQSAINNAELPDTIRSFVLEGGTLANVSFVTIPFNAAHREGAMVLANFLLSPEAQARKQDPAVWGGLTVLDLSVLPAEDRALFAALDLGRATLTPDQLGPPLPEPHPSWMEALEAEWARRYTRR